MSVEVHTYTPWAYAQHLLPADTVERLVSEAEPAELPSIVGFTLNEINELMAGEWGAVCGLLGKSQQTLTTGEAISIAAWLRKELDGIGSYYDAIDSSTPDLKAVSATVEGLPFLAGCAVRAVKYFALPNVAEAQKTRLADIMLMDKAASIEARIEQKYHDRMMRKQR